MERTYLEWNLPNWITITLMATVGTVAFGTALAFYRKFANGSAPPAASN